MRRIWSSPNVSCDWGEPENFEAPCLGCVMTVTFGDTVAQSFPVWAPRYPEDKQTFERFARFLREAKVKAVSGGLPEWYRFLSSPLVKEAEKAVLDSRSVTERPVFLDKTIEDGAPHDYAFYRDYVWTLDDDLRFGFDHKRLRQRLDQECQRLESLAHPQPVAAVAGRPRIPESVRHEVWRREQGQCARCGSRERLEIDHIVPLAMGGSNTARNFELLCENCNRRKGASLSVE
jgi:hypothetical protein